MPSENLMLHVLRCSEIFVFFDVLIQKIGKRKIKIYSAKADISHAT